MIDLLAEVAQLVEHGTENAGVDSSILSLGTSAANPLFFVANFLSPSPSNLPIADILPTLVSVSPLP